MPALNYNYNYNYNYAARGGGGGGGRQFRERFNTDYYTRLGAQAGTVVPPVPVPPYPPYAGNWDPNMRAYKELDDFVRRINILGSGDWLANYANIARNSGGPARLPPQEMNQNQLNAEIKEILQESLEREPRFCEIIDQDDGDGAINYLLGMLEINPAHHPNTIRVVSIGRRIGEYVVMRLKDNFNSPRPSELSPAVTPMIDPPGTASFPAGHAVQAYLISYLIAYGINSEGTGVLKLPNHTLPAIASLDPNDPVTHATGLLFDLANRISENRIVAGIHYPVDIAAGRAIAIKCFIDITSVPSIWTTSSVSGLNVQMGKEFPQYNRT